MTTFNASGPVLGVTATPGLEFASIMLTALQNGEATVVIRPDLAVATAHNIRLSDTRAPAAGGGWLDMPFQSPNDDKLAMIAFTSGTEGTPKSVYLSRASLHDVVDRLTSEMNLTSDAREYVGVPVDHSFGYGRCRAILNAGGQCFLPDAGFDLQQIKTMLQAGEINAISAVPSLWRIFLSNLELFGSELSNVKWIEIGSQFMEAQEKAALRDALPNARIVQHYGLTEASRSTFLRIDDRRADLNSVGRAVGETALTINAAGRICVRGPHVARAIGQAGQIDIRDSADWFETSDLGRLHDGWLFYEGRADDVINCAGIKLSPDRIEAYVRQQNVVLGDFGVVGIPDKRRGETVLVALTPKSQPQRDAIVAAVTASAQTEGANISGSVSVVVMETLPRTATGKLQRKLLVSALPDTTRETANEQPHNFASFATSLLNIENAATEPRSVQDLGADSLNHMELTLALERALGTAPDQWEWQPLCDLVQMVDAAGDFQNLMKNDSGAPPLPNGSTNENPKGISFWSLVREDFHTNGSSLTHQGFLMLFVHRFGNWRMDIKLKLLRAPMTLLYLFLNKLTELFFGMKLGYTVKVGRRVKLEHFGGMILGAREIGDDVVLRQNTTMGIRSIADTRAKPTLGQGVDVGAGAVITGNITIGANAVIGANSVVYTNVPPGAVVMGVPARIIGSNQLHRSQQKDT